MPGRPTPASGACSSSASRSAAAAIAWRTSSASRCVVPPPPAARRRPGGRGQAALRLPLQQRLPRTRRVPPAPGRRQPWHPAGAGEPADLRRGGRSRPAARGLQRLHPGTLRRWPRQRLHHPRRGRGAASPRRSANCCGAPNGAASASARWANCCRTIRAACRWPNWCAAAWPAARAGWECASHEPPPDLVAAADRLRPVLPGSIEQPWPVDSRRDPLRADQPGDAAGRRLGVAALPRPALLRSRSPATG